MNEQPPGSMRPLVVRCGAFGDMVLLTPLIRRLAERFQQPVDLVSSGPWTIPLLQGQPGVGRIHLLESRNTPYWLNFPKQRIARELRRNGPAPAWFCDGNGAAFDVLQKGGVPKDWVLDVRDLAFGAREHFVIRWSRFANMTPPGLSVAPSMSRDGMIGDGTSPVAVQAAVIDVLPAWRSDLSTWLESRGLGNTTLHLVQAGNKRTMRSGRRDRATNTKYWPEERWAEVVRHIRHRSPESSILLLGTPGESELNDDIIRLSATKNVHNAALDLPIPRLLALMESASSLVTVDSGPAHAAAAVGCPQVVLFGQADPELYRPWGAAGAQAECLTGTVDGQASMLGIGAGEVTAAWDALEKRARPSPAVGVAAH